MNFVKLQFLTVTFQFSIRPATCIRPLLPQRASQPRLAHCPWVGTLSIRELQGKNLVGTV